MLATHSGQLNEEPLRGCGDLPSAHRALLQVFAPATHAADRVATRHQHHHGPRLHTDRAAANLAAGASVGLRRGRGRSLAPLGRDLGVNNMGKTIAGLPVAHLHLGAQVPYSLRHLLGHGILVHVVICPRRDVFRVKGPGSAGMTCICTFLALFLELLKPVTDEVLNRGNLPRPLRLLLGPLPLLCSLRPVPQLLKEGHGVVRLLGSKTWKMWRLDPDL